MTERRVYGGEVRALPGNLIAGTALRYGEVAPNFRERFMPGAFGRLLDVPLNLQHDPSVSLGVAELTDTPAGIEARARVPNAIHTLVRRGSLGGFSVEFTAQEERQEHGIRVIQSARLDGLAVVDRGAYPGSKVEARARTGKVRPGTKVAPIFDWQDPEEIAAKWAAGAKIPTRDMWSRSAVPKSGGGCECCGDGVNVVGFREDAWKQVIDAVRRREHRVSIHTGRYDVANLLATTDNGSLRLASGPRGLGVFMHAGVSDTPAARKMITSLPAGRPVVRPLIDFDRSTYTDVDGVRLYETAFLASLLVKWSPVGGDSWWNILFNDDDDPEDIEPEGRSMAWWA